MSDTIKVSVTIFTYNQEKFIAQAIEGALNQTTDFEYEILVGDDFSTDRTRAIVLEYQQKYPDLVKPVFHPRNLGQNGLFNAIETTNQARGKYVATTDGDDYWTDPTKLQKQADFMDNHPDFSACFNNTLVIYEDGSPSEILNPPSQKAVITVEDLIGEDEIWFMGTSSVMYRNGLWHKPEWMMKSSSGDIPRYVILAKQGPIGYLSEVMGIYRKHRAGVSFNDNYRDERFLRNRIEMYEGINQELDYRFDAALKKNIARYYRNMLDAKQYQNRYFARAALAFRYIQLAKPTQKVRREIVRDYILPTSVMKIYSFFALLPHRK